MTESVGVPGGEEENILRTVGKLCELLQVKFRPIAVTWMGNLGHPLNLPSDQCVFMVKGPRRGHVVLPAAVRSKLDHDEWEPLIASSIFYQLRPEIRRVWTAAFWMIVVSLIAALVAPFTLWIIGESVFSFQITGLLFFASLMWIFLPRANNFFLLRRLRLKADRLAAGILGKEQFLRTLEKIDAMRIVDLEEGKRKKRTIMRQVLPWPTITERLESLRGLVNS